MKKVKVYQLFIVLLVALGFSSCTKDEPTPQPAAEFTNVITGPTRTVVFTNTSTNSESYSWAFGDGKTSIEKSPTHVYAQGGTYVVILTAVGAVGTTTSTKTMSIEIPIPKNYVKGGEFETGDASAWTVLKSGQKDGDGNSTNVKYQFGYTTYKPTLGTGGSLYIFPTNTTPAKPNEEGTVFFQSLGALEAGTYQISALVKLAGEDKVLATAMKDYWFEFIVNPQLPVDNDGYNINPRTTGWIFGGWTGWQYVVPPIDGLLPHTYGVTNLAANEGKFTLTAGTYYLAIKVGKGTGATFGAGIALDKLTINKL